MPKRPPSVVVAMLAGGAGTRFWPASTEDRPKQFLPLAGDRSLFAQAYERVEPLVDDDALFAITSARYVAQCRAALPRRAVVVGEPDRRDTAGAIALAVAFAARRAADDTVMVVLPSDHVIAPVARFRKALRSAIAAARASRALYTFGIAPTFPATGYGYLERGAALPVDDDIAHARVKRFVEKPERDVAERYLKSGRFLWNSGMFVWRVDAIRAALARFLPAHAAFVDDVAHARAAQVDKKGALVARARAAFAALPRISIDYGVMEKHDDVRVVDGGFAWSDVGSFPSLADHLPKDAHENAHRGTLFTHDANGNVVFALDDEEAIALVGVSGLVVVRAGKRTLVVDKRRAEDVKKLVDALPPALRAGDDDKPRTARRRGGRDG